MFKRDILVALEQWANKPNRKPLVLRGARQVGKTSVVNSFGEQFDNYLYVNLERSELRQIVESNLPEQTIVTNLFAAFGKLQKQGRTLLFLDEIQNSSIAVQKLRYFYEEMPSLYVIAAGSLLESLLDTHISFPVGRVEYMAMRPVSFREFLTANGRDALRQLIEQSPESSIGLDYVLQSEFRQYACIGGFPEVVASFIENHDIVALDGIHDSILTSYLEDVEKYAANDTQRHVIRFVIEHGWNCAGEIVSFNNFANSVYRTREMGEAMRTLQKTMLMELVYPLSNTIFPIQPEYNRAPKLLWVDSGQVNYVAGIRREILFDHDIMDAWKGRYAEHLVGQELLTLDNRVLTHRYYWSRPKATAEVDFVLPYDGKVIPIEVKAGHNAHLRSLHQFMDNCPHDIAIRVWSQPLQKDIVKTPKGKQFTLYNIPFYLVGMIPTVLQKY